MYTYVTTTFVNIQRHENPVQYLHNTNILRKKLQFAIYYKVSFIQ